MIAHRIETTIGEDSSLTLPNLPFKAGTSVEVIVLEYPNKKKVNVRDNPFYGMPFEYDDPFSPVGVEDWDVLT